MHVRMCKEDNICWQRRLNHSGVGGGIALRGVYPARAYTTIVVLFSFFLQGIVERNHYHIGDVEHALGPKGHYEDILGLQVYWTSK